jgi:hypothetical protein
MTGCSIFRQWLNLIRAIAVSPTIIAITELIHKEMSHMVIEEVTQTQMVFIFLTDILWAVNLIELDRL